MHDHSRLRHGLAATVDENSSGDLARSGGGFQGIIAADVAAQKRAAQDRQKERKEEQARGMRAHCLRMACDTASHGVSSAELVRVAGEFYAFVTKSENA